MQTGCRQAEKTGERAQRRKQNPEVIARRNDKTSSRALSMVAEENFGAGDIELCIIADEQGDARKNLRKFIRICAAKHKAIKAEFRYLYTMTEKNSKAETKTIVQLLLDGALGENRYCEAAARSFGSACTKATRISDDAGGRLALPKRQERGGERGHRWACSRNLKR